MKSKYEISVWSDVWKDGQLEEQKEIVIGSDTMTSESRAREPKMISNINGTNKFTFNMYYRYIDTRTGEEVINPYIKYLVNERKIKVLWKDEWYDLLIKQIKEDQSGRVFTYSCEDSYITELSRTGFELEFATELENNIGTAAELVEKTIENTDWLFDKNSSDIIYQETEEAVYHVEVLHSFDAVREPDGTSINIVSGYPILIFYSSAYDKDSLKDNCQFYYTGSNVLQQDQNDMLVINGNSYHVNVNWVVEDNIAIAYIDEHAIFRINFTEGLSSEYRAKRMVNSQKTIYNDIVGRYVNVYNDGTVYGYQTTQYDNAQSVVNLITNSSNFKDFSGWIGDDMKFELYPPFNGSTSIASYVSTSYLKLKCNEYYFNTGIQNNRVYIPNGFIVGEKYIFRIKARSEADGTAGGNWIKTASSITPYIQSHDTSYTPTGTNYFTITSSPSQDDVADGDWIEYKMTCIKSCSYEELITTPMGLFIEATGTSTSHFYIQNIEFFREAYGKDVNGNEIRINPNEMDTQSIAKTSWKYFNANQPEGTTKDTLEYIHSSEEEWDEAIPDSNHYAKFTMIEESQSNRFNILQTIAEKFECWVKFIIEHDENGYIKKDGLGRREKYIQLKREIGQETGIGFLYGIDLKGVTRTVKSNQISTKTIVGQNDNEFGENGFCSIARSQYNYPKENVIYNFDYYIRQGLLNEQVLQEDLYGTNGYYIQLHNKNTAYMSNVETIATRKNELTRQKATAKLYDQYLVAAKQEKSSIEDSLMKLAGVSTIADVTTYAANHLLDTKVQSLINDRNNIIRTIEEYEALSLSINQSITFLETSLTALQSSQDQIIEQLKELNKQFFIKYAPYIQEGTWSSEDYWNDDLYYLDALQVAYTSSRPQVQYEIDVMRLSDLEDFKSKVFRLGDISFVQDVKYFGYMPDGITPYKEKVLLSEITSFFDTPDKDILKVQNYKTQFDDLFQRITAATQTLEFSQGKYARAANVVNNDGTIKSSVIQNTFNTNKDLVYGAQNEAVTMDQTGLTVTNNDDGAHLVKVTSGGVFVSNDGGETWKNAIRGDGINTELLTAGRINTEQITVYNGDFPSFRWDAYGLNAYSFDNETGVVNTTQFVRFDQYGIYGLQNAAAVYRPSSETDVWNNANFGLTWRGFFLKNSNNSGSVEISTDNDIVIKGANNAKRVTIGRLNTAGTNYGMAVYDANGNAIFQCDNTISKLCGWELSNNCLSSTPDVQNRSIKIYSDGNIGSYGNESYSVTELAYTTTVSGSLQMYKLSDGASVPISSGTIYPFVNSIGPIITSYQVISDTQISEGSDSNLNNAKFEPNLPSVIQLMYSNVNYYVEGLTWNKTYVKSASTRTEDTKTSTIPDGNTTKTITTYIYTYKYVFNVTAKQNGHDVFTINYNSTQVSKTKYTPASDTSWYIDNKGDAVFHNINADGGKIAGWFVDNESIYQTYDGTKDKIKDGANNVKTQLNSSGTGKAKGDDYNLDYTFITDAINAGMAVVGDVIMSGGLINGYNIAVLANRVEQAYQLASAAYTKAGTVPAHTHSLTNSIITPTFYPNTQTIEGFAAVTGNNTGGVNVGS